MHSRALPLFLFTAACATNPNYAMEYRPTCVVQSSEAVDADTEVFGLTAAQAAVLAGERLSGERVFEAVQDDAAGLVFEDQWSVQVSLAGDAQREQRVANEPECVAGDVVTVPVTLALDSTLLQPIAPLAGKLVWTGTEPEHMWLALWGDVIPGQALTDEAQRTLDHINAGGWCEVAGGVSLEDVTFGVSRRERIDEPLSVAASHVGMIGPCFSYGLASEHP